MSKELFKSYPSVNVFYKTSDGQYFEQKHHAEAHAGSLDNSEIETVEREKTKAEKSGKAEDKMETPGSGKTAEDNSAKEAPKAEKPKVPKAEK